MINPILRQSQVKAYQDGIDGEQISRFFLLISMHIAQFLRNNRSIKDYWKNLLRLFSINLTAISASNCAFLVEIQLQPDEVRTMKHTVAPI
uniref:Transposase n=1 Tax=Romanomermis culicivorax TaxID=13658 RepID=A0A915IED3_ROMCU